MKVLLVNLGGDDHERNPIILIPRFSSALRILWAKYLIVYAIVGSSLYPCCGEASVFFHAGSCSAAVRRVTGCEYPDPIAAKYTKPGDVD